MGKLTTEAEGLASSRVKTSETKERRPQLWPCFSFQVALSIISARPSLIFLSVGL